MFCDTVRAAQSLLCLPFNGERRKIGILQLRVRPMGRVRRFLQHYIQRIIHMIRYIGLHMNCTGRFYRYPQGRFAGAAAQTDDITKQNTTNPSAYFTDCTIYDKNRYLQTQRVKRLCIRIFHSMLCHRVTIMAFFLLFSFSFIPF